jgi:hypothetical protein
LHGSLLVHVTPAQQFARQTPLAQWFSPAQQGASTVATLPATVQQAPAWHACPEAAHGVQIPPPLPQSLASAT